MTRLPESAHYKPDAYDIASDALERLTHAAKALRVVADYLEGKDWESELIEIDQAITQAERVLYPLPCRVYFDVDADIRDGMGWTVDDGGGVIERYTTEAEARR